MLNVTKQTNKVASTPTFVDDLKDAVSYCWTMKPGDPYYHGICLLIGGMVGCFIFILLSRFQ